MSGVHARLSASSAERWMNCGGSVALIERLPRQEYASRAAEEGTVAHDIAAEVLEGKLKTAAERLRFTYKRGPHTIVVDEEMVDGVNFYVDSCEAATQTGDQKWVEMKLLKALSKLHPALGGTADYVRWRPGTHDLLVADLKYGAGTFVAAEDNRQLRVYALGVLLQTGVPARTVTVRIVQPRIEHAEGRVRDWTFPAADILEFAADLVQAAEAALRPGAALNPGPWCKKTFCAAAATCPALEKRQHALVAAEFSAVAPYDVNQLADALGQIEMVKARIKALEEFAYAEANRGVTIPGFKLVEKRATRRIVDDAAAVKWAEANGVEPFERKLRSPAQLEKAFAETAPRGQKKAYEEQAKAALAPIVVSESSGTVLVPDSDGRAPVAQLTVDSFSVVAATPESKQSLADNLFS